VVEKKMKNGKKEKKEGRKNGLTSEFGDEIERNSVAISLRLIKGLVQILPG
jgi:hypothetical protein